MSITGEEIAYRTLAREKVGEACLLTAACMKRAFYQHYAGECDIYRHPVETTVTAYRRAGANLCPQFIMPSPVTEHLADDPFALVSPAAPAQSVRLLATPEEVRDEIDALPAPDTLALTFDLEAEAEAYARRILHLRDLAQSAILFIDSFGQADFMDRLTTWGYVSYLSAVALYPEHLKRYWDYTGEQGRLHNLAVVRAIQKYGLAPFVYGGQDIRFNGGPMVRREALEALYFPALAHAVQPLHDAGIAIIWHCDGDVRPIAPILLECIGVQGFQGFQEETGCTLEHMASLRTRQGMAPILWGSVSVTTTLPFGSVTDVKRDVERCFLAARRAGAPFALASSSSILPETPLENIHALFEHGIYYGREVLHGRVSI